MATIKYCGKTYENVELRVWHNCQVGRVTHFYVDVATYQEGQKICDVLGQYDLFQLEHNIKPDFANANGIAHRHPELTEGEWWDINPEDIADSTDDMEGYVFV